MFWPLSAHLSGSPVSCDTPSRLGPRASGQSPSMTLRGPAAESPPPPCAASKVVDAISPALTTTAANNDFFSIFIALLAVTPVDHCPFQSTFFHWRRGPTPAAY